MIKVYLLGFTKPDGDEDTFDSQQVSEDMIILDNDYFKDFIPHMDITNDVYEDCYIDDEEDVFTVYFYIYKYDNPYNEAVKMLNKFESYS